MKISLFVIAMVLIGLPAVSAHSGSDHSDFSDIQQLIDNPVDCSQLTDDQLERIGDYFMEQMHSGEGHEKMDAMMGGEGSQRLRERHIMMGQSFYCNDSSFGMMGSGMMSFGQAGMGYGFGFLPLLVVIVIALAAIIIVLLIRRK